MKSTFLTVESTTPIATGASAMIQGRTQVPLRLHRLRIDPAIAPFFVINELRIGVYSKMPQAAQGVPCSQFMHGSGENWDIGEMSPGIELSMFVTNISERVPGGTWRRCRGCGNACDDVPRDGGTVFCPPCCRKCGDEVIEMSGAPLPFAATWAALVVPPRHAVVGSAYDGLGDRADRAEDLGSRIGHVPEAPGVLGASARLTPMPKRRDHPGFGWDPGYDD